MIQSPNEVVKQIKLVSSDGFNVIKGEVDKLLDSVNKDVQSVIDLAVEYQRKAEESRIEWKQVNEEVIKLKGTRDALKKREEEVDLKIQKANTEEESLLALHKVLENRKKMLDAREEEIVVRERRQNEV